VNPFQYTARESDPETGLYYYRARYYDSTAGRFLSEDPLEFGGSGPNFYVYVFNSAINLLDPTGLLRVRSIEAWDVLDGMQSGISTKLRNTVAQHGRMVGSTVVGCIKIQTELILTLHRFPEEPLASILGILDPSRAEHISQVTTTRTEPTILTSMAKELIRGRLATSGVRMATKFSHPTIWTRTRQNGQITHLYPASLERHREPLKSIFRALAIHEADV
jgi:RHS repeat-associated protein